MDEITPLSGVTSTSVYDATHKPLGSEILADFMLLVNKAAEEVDGLNELSERLDQADSDIDDLESWQSTITPILGAAVAAAELAETELDTGGTKTLTKAECNENYILVVREGVTDVVLPDGMATEIESEGWTPHLLTIINADDSAITISLATGGYWGGAQANTYTLELAQGECVTVLPTTTLVATVEEDCWTLVAGQTTLTAP